MKKTIIQTFMAVLLFTGLTTFSSVQAQGFDEGFCYDPCNTSNACVDPCVIYDSEPCFYDWDECSWEPCCDSPQRFYLGPVYYFRRTDFSLDDCTNNNVFGLDSNGKVRGHFIGVNFGYEYREICAFYARVDAIWSTGSERPCPKIRVTDWQAEARIGYTWGECVPAGYAVSPYVGVGYLWQSRNYSHFHFKSNYDTWYVPIGIYADVEVVYGFTAGIDFAFAPFFSSNVDTRHRDFDLDRNGSRSRYLWRVSLPLRWQVMCDAGFEISVEPFWEQLHFGRICSRTDTVGDVVIPGVPQFREDFWGAKFLAAYKF